MTITTLNSDNVESSKASKTKIVFIVILFLISLAAFVSQTEFTSQAYKIGFEEPIILLYLTHGMWWTFWPLQLIITSIWKTFLKRRRHHSHGLQDTSNAYQRLASDGALLENQQQPSRKHKSILKYLQKSTVMQVKNVYYSSILVYEANVNGDRSTTNLDKLIQQNPNLDTDSLQACLVSFMQTPSFKYLVVKTFIITTVLTLGGLTWYGAMALTYASDVTAIYNCSAFTAYAFAIPILKEKFSILKASSVVVAILGVFIVAYSGSSSEEDKDYPYQFWGNLIVAIGAVLYGYYEVLYKKYACIPEHLSKLITPRRQLTFANFFMCLMGIATFLIMSVCIIFVELAQIHHFKLNYGKQNKEIWCYILGSLASNLLFSASFLSLMALTSPVLSSVSSLLTIFLIGLVEWLIFGNSLGLQQLIGNALVIAGFVILTMASWKEISEGSDEDEMDTASTVSFPVSALEDQPNN